jgi:2-hydroxy-6-oxonona-2,4-dienedioate hydrolase
MAQTPSGHNFSALAARRDSVGGMAVFSRYTLAPVHSRQPIVLIHGLGLSSAFHRPALRRVGNHHRAHAPDLPGHGLSDKPNPALDIQQQAEALARWMEAIKLGSAVVAGVSMGSQYASALAARRPDLVRGLVLASPTMDPQLRSAPKAMLSWLLELRNELPISALMARDYLRAGVRRSDDSFAQVLADRPEDRLAGLAMPTLVLHGEADRLVSREWAREVADRLPSGRLVELPGAAHSMNWSAADEFARLVVEFTDELVGTAPAAERELAA